MVDTEALDLFARDELELRELRSLTCGFTQADWEFISVMLSRKEKKVYLFQADFDHVSKELLTLLDVYTLFYSMLTAYVCYLRSGFSSRLLLAMSQQILKSGVT